MRRRSAHRGQNGAAAVEFALVMPLLLLFLFGIVEFGFVMYDKALLTNASREAARAGIVLKTPKLTELETKQIARKYCSGLVTFATAQTEPSVDVTPPPWTSGKDLTVTVSYPYTTLLLGKLIRLVSRGTFTEPIQLSATSTMINE